MKTASETKTDRQTTWAFLLMVAIVFLIALAMNSCTCKSSTPVDWDAYMADRHLYFDSLRATFQKDTAKWAQFMECSRYEGDAGCDSCFQLVFGFPFPE